MKAYPVKHLSVPFFKEKLIQRCCHLPLNLLIVFFLKHPLSPRPDSVSSSADSSKIQLLSRRVQQEKWGTLSTLSGEELALRNASPSHARTQTISAIDGWDFTALLQLARWILRWWFIRISHFKSPLLCHAFSQAVPTEGPGARFWTTAPIWCFWMTVHIVVGCYPPSDTNGDWQREAISHIRFSTYTSPACLENISVLWLEVLMKLGCKTCTFCFFLFLWHWVFLSWRALEFLAAALILTSSDSGS